MLKGIATTFLNWLGPGIIGAFAAPAVDAYKAKLANETDGSRLAAELAGRELAVDQREKELRSAERMAMKWHHPAMLICYGVAFYFLKAVVWDSCFGLGETPVIRGAVGEWMGTAMTFMVGGASAAASATTVGAVIGALVKGRR